MQYGFVIDQDACIGCHACTVACKAENDVPVGGFRTNVKYVEIGKFPEIKRNFLVQRCNHCTDAPCVTICPVNALKKRPDGIVDVDRDACIGCRACMQACPYDAIYLNEDLGAVEKCHFCAHRIEKGLEPACVTVCPVGAIIPGDFHDPESRVSLISRAKVLSARRPEQGTGPNVKYIGANEVALKPGSASKGSQYIWSQRRPTKPDPWPAEVATVSNAREVLNAEHKVEWGWTVGLYLLTKGIAAGAAMLAPFLALAGHAKTMQWWLPEAIALFFTAVTVFLLIEDLAKPMHFYKLFTRPNKDSWLVKGGIILTAFAAVSALIILFGFLGPPLNAFVQGLRWVNAFVGILVATYTAFLFRQCKGRDLWEAGRMELHLFGQSLAAGAAFYFLVGAGNTITVAGLVFGALVILAHHRQPVDAGDRTDNFTQAMGFLHEARFGGLRIAQTASWLIPTLAVMGGLSLLFPSHAAVPLAVAGALALAVMLLYELAFVRAGQLPPLS